MMNRQIKVPLLGLLLIEALAMLNVWLIVGMDGRLKAQQKASQQAIKYADSLEAHSFEVESKLVNQISKYENLKSEYKKTYDQVVWLEERNDLHIVDVASIDSLERFWSNRYD